MSLRCRFCQYRSLHANQCNIGHRMDLPCVSFKFEWGVLFTVAVIVFIVYSVSC